MCHATPTSPASWDVNLEGMDMYETCIGPSASGGLELVWHIVAKNARTTLCGYPLPRSHPLDPASAKETIELHCTPCMTAFRSVMEAGPQ